MLPTEESPEAFGAALATVAGVELRAEGLNPSELNEIGRRAGEAIRDAVRERWQGGGEQRHEPEQHLVHSARECQRIHQWLPPISRRGDGAAATLGARCGCT